MVDRDSHFCKKVSNKHDHIGVQKRELVDAPLGAEVVQPDEAREA
jgi:hypothetical protein